MRKFVTRTIFGALYVAIVLASIYFQQDYYTLSILAGIFNLVGLIEFSRMARKIQGITVKAGWFPLPGCILYLAFPLAISVGWSGGWLLFPLAMISLFISSLYNKRNTAIQELGMQTLGISMITIPLGLINFISVHGNDFHIKGSIWVYALFIFIWVNDTFAYLIGSLWGKHRLFERVSPKKSWEGCIGGAVVTLMISAAVWYLSGFGQLCQWVCVALACVIAGTYGDLLESLLKRTAGVKDSGKIIPGHGGILDRIDSILMATPVILAVFEIINSL